RALEPYVDRSGRVLGLAHELVVDHRRPEAARGSLVAELLADVVALAVQRDRLAADLDPPRALLHIARARGQRIRHRQRSARRTGRALAHAGERGHDSRRAGLARDRHAVGVDGFAHGASVTERTGVRRPWTRVRRTIEPFWPIVERHFDEAEFLS